MNTAAGTILLRFKVVIASPISLLFDCTLNKCKRRANRKDPEKKGFVR